MKPSLKKDHGQQDLFRRHLDQIINMNHSLTRLGELLNWERFVAWQVGSDNLMAKIMEMRSNFVPAPTAIPKSVYKDIIFGHYFAFNMQVIVPLFASFFTLNPTFS